MLILGLVFLRLVSTLQEFYECWLRLRMSVQQNRNIFFKICFSLKFIGRRMIAQLFGGVMKKLPFLDEVCDWNHINSECCTLVFLDLYALEIFLCFQGEKLIKLLTHFSSIGRRSVYRRLKPSFGRAMRPLMVQTVVFESLLSFQQDGFHINYVSRELDIRSLCQLILVLILFEFMTVSLWLLAWQKTF